MNAYALVRLVFERMELVEELREIYFERVRSKGVFDVPIQLGLKLIKTILDLDERGELFSDNGLKDSVRKDFNKFLFAVRMVLVIIVRECEMSPECEIWEMHELLMGEDDLISGWTE